MTGNMLFDLHRMWDKIVDYWYSTIFKFVLVTSIIADNIVLCFCTLLIFAQFGWVVLFSAVIGTIFIHLYAYMFLGFSVVSVEMKDGLEEDTEADEHLNDLK